MPAREALTVFRKRLAPGVIIAAVLLALPFVPRVLRACGPYFPLEILSTRTDAVMAPPPAPSMTDGLVPAPGEKLPVDESDNEEARTRAELDKLTPEHQELVKAMRSASNGDAAYAAGEGLPPLVRDYTAGAVSYHDKQFDKARDYFTRVLTDTPVDPGEVRVVWARYMLGGLAYLQGDSEAASAHWAATRGLVRSGHADPLGLAVASFGEEARVWLKPGTFAKAVGLYAKQASYGSERGRASLLMVAEQALGDPKLLEEGLQDVTTRRVILRYLYSGEQASEPDVPSDEDKPPADAADDKTSADKTSADKLAADKPAADKPPAEKTPVNKPDPLTRVLEIFERQRATNVEGADLLAAQAYANGRFDVAASLAAYESTALSAWIKGKLALRSGDRQTALQAFADAVRGLPTHHEDRRRAMAETGVLKLSAGDYAQAMELLYAAVVDASTEGEGYGGPDYWTDVAYIAERVLKLDELLPLVDRLAPPLSQAELDAIKKQTEGPEGEWRRESPAEQLRELTARRLMRAGRSEEALRYFDADQKLREAAKSYIDAVSTARSVWSRQTTRAEAWFTAAGIARTDGLNLLGFELAPDYGVHDGMFEGVPPPPGDLVARASTPKGPASATADEVMRVDTSKPATDSRFHYRLTAVDHALLSADGVPASSQAFAAILCRATSWVIDREPKRAAEVYARYVKEGPYVSWGGTFGRECPEPDFAAANRRRWKDRLAIVTWFYTDHPLRTGGGAGLFAVAGIAWFTWRKKPSRKA